GFTLIIKSSTELYSSITIPYFLIIEKAYRMHLGKKCPLPSGNFIDLIYIAAHNTGNIIVQNQSLNVQK
ncbi:MAG: hypothetical protein VYC19_04700, partial [Pseudomonadota bacterium]|nr:hypothetical protein [Pseudomonadota bacterium]